MGCTSTRMLLVEFLGTWIYLTLGGLGTLRTPYLPSVTWGVSLTAGYLLGGQESHLNPAVTLGLTAAGRSKLASLPGRLVGQFLGGYVAGMTLTGIAPVGIVERMIGDTNHTSLDWSVAGCITASLLHWILILVPSQIHQNRQANKKKIFSDEENNLGEVTRLMQEKPPSFSRLTYVTPPVPPPQPSYDTSSVSSTPPQLRTLFREKPTRGSAIQRYCKKNNISTADLDRYLERYQAVNLDTVDVGNGVTVKVNDEEVDTDQKKELVNI